MILTVTANPSVDKVYHLEKFNIGKVHRAEDISVSAGGKGLNVSRVAKILGEEVTAMGFIGGASGKFIREQIEALGITAAFTEIEGETRTNVNISDLQGNSTELLEKGPQISAFEIDRFLKEFNKRLDECDIVCASGSLPRGVEPSFYLELVKLCKIKNKPIIVDTSGKAMKEVLDAAPFMIKPNRDEIADLLGFEPKDREDIKKALKLLKCKGVSLPIVTLGGDGAMAMIDDKIYSFSVPKVNVKNAVGSGDSTVAGILVGICRKMPFVDCVRLGLASGTANTQHLQTGIVTLSDIEKYYSLIKII